MKKNHSEMELQIIIPPCHDSYVVAITLEGYTFSSLFDYGSRIIIVTVAVMMITKITSLGCGQIWIGTGYRLHLIFLDFRCKYCQK